MTTDPAFVHLHTHSDYSIQDGLNKISALTEHARKRNIPAFAITDRNNLFGSVKFCRCAQQCGVKPIIGMDVVVRSCFRDAALSPMTILLLNRMGYRNLTQLISRAYRTQQNSRFPVIHQSWMPDHCQGLILLSHVKRGDLGSHLIQGCRSILNDCIAFYRKYFPDRYFLEIVRLGEDNEEKYIHDAVNLAVFENIPVVATNDVRFLRPKDFQMHRIRVAIHHNQTLHEVDKHHPYSPNQYMKSERDMVRLFADLPEALQNSVQIAKRCNFTMIRKSIHLPKFFRRRSSDVDYLTQCARRGLKNRLTSTFVRTTQQTQCVRRNIYEKRLQDELNIINRMRFPSYFLIVMEFVQWAKTHGVPVGPGRGSGTGSLVAYALHITDVDPIRFDLLFERFLNPERVSMPDFDVDFCMEKRDLVIDHVFERYGSECVSQIITFNTLSARAVVRDVGRVLDYPYPFVDRIAKLVFFDSRVTLQKAIALEPKLHRLYRSDPNVRNILNLSMQLEGTIRNIGKHAGGVVIAPTKTTDFLPIYSDDKKKYFLTQFDKDDVEEIGLVKFDFLGLRTLTVIQSTLDMIHERLPEHGARIDLSVLPLDDPRVFRILQTAETTAIFQLESHGMKALIRRLRPDCFADIVALIALFRPGPLQSGMVENFIRRKQGKEKIFYPDAQWQHPMLEPILKSTYGVILYQEQVMQIAQVLARYSLEEADVLRRVVGKKNPHQMRKQRTLFRSRAEANGIDAVLASKIFELMEKFAGYGFNKSHSAAYAIISYQTLWLKIHYPAEFMAASMTSEMDNIDKLTRLIRECRRMRLTILKPNVNEGQHRFRVRNARSVLYGMGAIKGVGRKTIDHIVDSRCASGKFRDVFDFCRRLDRDKLNRRVLEQLIASGALDCMSENRALSMHLAPDALRSRKQTHTEDAFQSDMFESMIHTTQRKKIQNTHVSRWSKSRLFAEERKALGFYLSGHPIDAYAEEKRRCACCSSLHKAHCAPIDSTVTVAGWVSRLRVFRTKRKNRVGICTLTDRNGQLDVVLFRNVWEKYARFLRTECVLFATGCVRRSVVSNVAQMVAHRLTDIDHVQARCARRIVIRAHGSTCSVLLKTLDSFPSGVVPIHIVRLQDEDQTVWKRRRIACTAQTLRQLRAVAGSDRVDAVL